MQEKDVGDHELLLGLDDDLQLFDAPEPGEVVLQEVFPVREEVRDLEHEDLPLLLGQLQFQVVVLFLPH